MNDEALSMTAAVLINVLIFSSMAFANMTSDDERPPEQPMEWVEFNPVELPKQGEERPETMLPRIVKNPEPPPPETDTASLSRKLKEKEELEKKKKEEEEKKQRELAEKKRRDEEKRKKDEERRKKKEEEDARKKRELRMKRALNRLKDPRADEDSPEGFADGDPNGTSTDPNARRNKATYINRVASAIREQFVVPTVISPTERNTLYANVAFKFGKDGKLIGAPRITKGSGNKLFDQAALRALKKFGAGSPARFPVPPITQAKLRRTVLGKGLKMKMSGKDAR